MVSIAPMPVFRADLRKLRKRSDSYSPQRGNADVREYAGLSALLSLLVDQDCLLPSAWRLIGAVDATRPAARSLLSLQQFLAGSVNAALARRWLLGVIDPANELIPAERSEVFPSGQDLWI